MKLVSSEDGGLTYLFPVDEMRPSSGVPIPDFVTKATERYEFVTPPSLERPWTEMRDGPLRFSGGVLKKGRARAVIKEFSLYTDGVAAFAHNTDDAERFIEDILNWGKKEFGLRDLVSAPRKLYVSTVIVDFEKEIDAIIQPMKDLQQLYAGYLAEHRNVVDDVRVTRLGFGVDPLKAFKDSEIPDFLIERRATHPFDDNRLISQAPLPTTVHLEFLQKLEKLI